MVEEGRIVEVCKVTKGLHRVSRNDPANSVESQYLGSTVAREDGCRGWRGVSNGMGYWDATEQ